jgi:hypothetical protein
MLGRTEYIARSRAGAILRVLTQPMEYPWARFLG